MATEKQGLTRFRDSMLARSVVLVRQNSSRGLSRGTGVVIPWGRDIRIVSAAHVLRDGIWEVEATDVASRSPSFVTEQNWRTVRMPDRRTLRLRLDVDPQSIGATAHDIAWASICADHEALRSEGRQPALPIYLGPLNVQPDSREGYGFAALTRDEHHRR